MSEKLVLEGHLFIVDYEEYYEYRIADAALWQHLRNAFGSTKIRNGESGINKTDFGNVRITIERLEESER